MSAISEATTTRVRGHRPAGRGGTLLADAFESVSVLPALAEARRRLLDACARPAVSPAELVDAIEADTALAIAVMQAANNGGGSPKRSGAISQAVEALDPERVGTIAAALPTYDVLQQGPVRAEPFERLRRHAVAVRLASERIADAARLAQRDELALAALLHDVGKLVLIELHGERWSEGEADRTPDERARLERRELGIDHAVIGGVLLRRWGIPDAIATAVERHHAADAAGHAAAIRLADLIVHHAGGAPVPAESLRAAAASVGIDGARLSALLFEFPFAYRKRRRASDPCPLSMRELDALRGLAEGKVYKQIASELSLSVSTIRTHLHNVYRKIGAADRAQAVLIARDRGWI